MVAFSESALAAHMAICEVLAGYCRFPLPVNHMSNEKTLVVQGL